MKRYPFNMSKHQHDIFFRYNRCKNELDDKFAAHFEGAYVLTDEEIDSYENLLDQLESLFGYGPGVVWLTGKEWALANETSNWAACVRQK